MFFLPPDVIESLFALDSPVSIAPLAFLESEEEGEEGSEEESTVKSD